MLNIQVRGVMLFMLNNNYHQKIPKMVTGIIIELSDELVPVEVYL